MPEQSSNFGTGTNANINRLSFVRERDENAKISKLK